MNETQNGTNQGGSDWWSRRPRRSREDRKVAGVAGGVGRYLGVDPVLLRVAFVVLTIFGGFGLFAYAAGWLLLAADGDEVCAAEALVGRGKSSVSTGFALVLGFVCLTSIASAFSWGLPFWPVVITAGVVLYVARKRGSGPFRPGSDWQQRMQFGGQQFGGQQFGGQQFGEQPQDGRTPHSSGVYGEAPASPFDAPSLWDQPATPSENPTPVSMTKTAQPGVSQVAAPPTPPAWDPLGAAPFAWDLPDIDVGPYGSTQYSPDHFGVTGASSTAVATRNRNYVITRLTLGFALLTGAVGALGVLGGWISWPWAVVSAAMLAVVALGLFVASLRGRAPSLIGPGIFLSVLTLALSVSGISGTAGFGNQLWVISQSSQLQPEYRINAGEGVLDLSGISLTAGESVTTSLKVSAGSGSVTLPAGVNLNVQCRTDAGDMDCLGEMRDGLRNAYTFTDLKPTYTGTINLTVQVNAGELKVSRG
ncbi:PspC domain-containing protein [Nakamurella antarctica]|uniref:PspC domain-containing protein n=1 Tax=Nakamurella antarctica TaxID=1902245 RepID=A0A3G8ZNC4_9ACTN|nr:PspC domain-containing protein [Nakamurella antarctica]AZI58638.1 PspC domain-containing protein [Nakamurella antarctica]